MTLLAPPARKLALTVHVLGSVGWLGAVGAFLVLSVVAHNSGDESLVRSTYLVMEPLGRYALVPLSMWSLVSGLIQSVGTRWGLLRHYWVVLKLGINLVAAVVLLLYVPTLASLAATARNSSATLDSLRTASPTLHSGAAIVLLVGATILSIYKPAGMTKYGQRRLPAERGG